MRPRGPAATSLVAFLAITAVLAAGCAQAPASTPEPGNAPFQGAARTSWSLVGATGTAEPTLGVTKDGTVLLVAGEDTWASRDSGRSWNVVHSLSKTDQAGVREPTTYDPWMWVDPVTDRVYVDHMWPILTCTLLTTSTDAGATWSPETPACPTPVVDFQKLVTNVPGPTANAMATGPSVAYLCYNKPVFDPTGVVPAGRYGLSCAASYDEGLTWVHEQWLTGALFVVGQTLQDGCYGGSWFPAMAPDGAVVVRAQPDCLFRTVDSGATWQPIGTGPKGIVGTELAFDPAGTLYALSASWEEAPLRLAVSHDQGASWNASVPIQPEGLNVAFESLVAVGPGHVAVALYATPGDANDPKVPDDAQWTPWILDVTGADTPRPHVEAHQITTAPIHVGCLDRGTAGCAFLGDFMRAALGPDGSVWAVYADDCPVACQAKTHPTSADLGPLDALVARLPPRTA